MGAVPPRASGQNPIIKPVEILALTVAGSLLLAAFFIVGFLGERAGGSSPNPDRDCLLPLDDDPYDPDRSDP